MNFFGRIFHNFQVGNFHSPLGILLIALGTGPYFGLILNPKRNTEFTVTKAKISRVYLCVDIPPLLRKKCMQVSNWIFHWAIKISVSYYMSMEFSEIH